MQSFRVLAVSVLVPVSALLPMSAFFPRAALAAGESPAATSAPAMDGGLAVPSLPGASPDKATTAKSGATSLLGDGAGARRIALPAPTAAELATMKAAPSTKSTTAAEAAAPAGPAVKAPSATGKRLPLKIGIVRDVADDAGAAGANALSWRTLADGTQVARVDVSSTGAAAVRAAIALVNAPPDVTLRFAGSAHPEEVFGPVSAIDVAVGGSGDLYWSPVLEGDTATIEIAVPPGIDARSIGVRVPKVAHLLVAGAALRTTQASLAKFNVASGIGTAGACEIDLRCEAPTAALNSAASSVAMTVVNDAKFVYQCTATLVNDSVGSRTPYLYTANHCLASDPSTSPRSTPAQMARTMNTYWFFDAATCGAKTTPDYTLVAGGAALLARGDDYDWAVVQMLQSPPSTASFSAWRAAQIATGTATTALHHPESDLKKISHGGIQRYTTYDDGSSFATVKWTSGVTEPGSSGSPLFIPNAAGFFELRGGLYGGDSDCSNPTGLDDYSRLDVAMPRIAQYLAPDVASASPVRPVVEYFNANLNDYFVTADPTEINCLDTGCHPGWERTGLRFLAYANPAVAPADAMPVCRFYVLPAFGDSHFYSADPTECARTAEQFKDAWVQESQAIFYIRLPDPNTGTCPANTEPVYRFVNNATPLHHRYAAEVGVRNCLAFGENATSATVDLNCAVPGAGVWQQEGYGTPPNAPVMCAPAN
jgi:hypothetical protein